MKITVLQNQSLLDVMLQYTGTNESLLEVALINNISITKDFKAGDELIIPNQSLKDLDILNFYQSQKIQPATAITNNPNNETPLLEGISIWAINNDFIVN